MILRFAASVLFLSLAVSALVKLRAELLFSSARSAEEELRLESRRVTASQVAAKLKRAAEATSAPTKSLAYYIQFLREYAAGARTQEITSQLSCEALRTLTRAIEKEPRNSRYLINWLDLNQLLKGSDCDAIKREVNQDEVIAFALKNAPTDPDVLYSAGLLQSWAGKHEEALGLFYRVLLLSTDLTSGREAVIASELKSIDDVERLIPARFPQAARWSKRFMISHPDLYRAYSEKFASLQLKALSFSTTEFESGEIPYEIHLARIISLESIAATDAVRKASDIALGRTLGEKSQSANYLAVRAGLDRLNIVPSVLVHDIRPQRAVFTSWNPKEKVFLDTHNTSVGFFLGPKQTLKFIELKSSEPARQLLSDKLQLLVSNDNYEWTEYTARAEKIDERDLPTTRFVIPISDSSFRYWKINYATSTKELKFSNHPGALIQAYGVKHAK